MESLRGMGIVPQIYHWIGADVGVLITIIGCILHYQNTSSDREIS